MKSKWLEILLNVFFWVITSWFIISVAAAEGHYTIITEKKLVFEVSYFRKFTWRLVICILISGSFFYLVLWTSLHTKLTNRRTIQAIKFTGLILVVVIASLLCNQLFFSSGKTASEGFFYLCVFIFYFISGISYGLGKLLQRNEVQKRQLMISKKDAELVLLRSQLQPHFLFNVLNNLLSMVKRSDNPDLAGAIVTLSDLLRHVVYESSGNKVSFSKEIEFIKNYAALQLLRFDKHEVDLRLTVEGSAESQYCEPGILIPFVENAFKFGAQPGRVSIIKINFNFVEKNKVIFQISNPIYPRKVMRAEEGIGQEVTKKRLALIYPGKHKLDIQDEGAQFVVHLELITDESYNHR